MVFCNNAAIASDGDVWFSDSSTRYGIERWKDDFVQDTRDRPAAAAGRRRAGRGGARRAGLRQRRRAEPRPRTSSRSRETAARTVVRRWLTGERAGQRDLLVDGPAGLPRQHRPRQRRADLGDDRLTARPARGAPPARPAVAAPPGRPASPSGSSRKPKRTVRVQAYDDDGRLVHDCDVRHDGYHMVTGVREHDGRVWLGSLEEPAVAVLNLRALPDTVNGRQHPRREAENFMGLLESISTPDDLNDLSEDQLDALATEIRDFLVATCSRTGRPPRPQPRRRRADHGDPPGLRLPARPGGLRHRSPGLRPQAAHRPAAGFDKLRQEGGRRGYPSQAESPHDIVENSHASTALSATPTAWPRPTRSAARTATWSPSSATARSPAAWPGRRSTTSRIANDRKLVIVVNDNGRSYTPTVGGLADHLTGLRTNPRYEHVLDMVKQRLNARPRRRPRGVRRAARDEEGHQGRARARRASSRTSG